MYRILTKSFRRKLFSRLFRRLLYDDGSHYHVNYLRKIYRFKNYHIVIFSSKKASILIKNILNPNLKKFVTKK